MQGFENPRMVTFHSILELRKGPSYSIEKGLTAFANYIHPVMY